MNKGDLVNEVAKVVNTKIEAQAAVDCVFSSIRGDFVRCIKKKRVADADHRHKSEDVRAWDVGPTESWTKKLQISGGVQTLGDQVALRRIAIDNRMSAVARCDVQPGFSLVYRNPPLSWAPTKRTTSLVGCTPRYWVSKGRNPQTGEEIDIKASNVPKLTPGQALKESVN